MVTVEMEPIIHFWRVFPADRKKWSTPGKYDRREKQLRKARHSRSVGFKKWKQWFHVPGS
jgi:hypothetical protein